MDHISEVLWNDQVRSTRKNMAGFRQVRLRIQIYQQAPSKLVSLNLIIRT